jgi:hypothetical protein
MEYDIYGRHIEMGLILCANYRRISVLASIIKLLSRVVKCKLENIIAGKLNDKQNWVRAGKIINRPL